jgi:hypothetical protein
VDEGRSAYTLNYKNLNIPDANNLVVLAIFGECDIRNYLPKYNNAKEVVEQYVNKTKEAFPNNRIIFVEPMPQVINLHKLDSKHTFENRLKQQNKFYEALSTHDIEILKMSDSIGIDRLEDWHTFDQQHLSDECADKLASYLYTMIKINDSPWGHDEGGEA